MKFGWEIPLRNMKESKVIKVLFGPANTASMPDITLQALNKTGGIEAKGISYGSNKYWSFGAHWTKIPVTPWGKNPFKRAFQIAWYKFEIARGIIWSDVIMWHWDIDYFEYWLIKLLKKPVLVEWIGSDIRVPEIVCAINAYHKRCWESGEYAYYAESKKRSDGIQQKFKQLHATPLVCPEMSLYLNPAIFPDYISFFQRIDIVNYAPQYPSPENKETVNIIHTPSSTGGKGTKYVREAIENLKQKGLQFQYIEIHNKSRQEALEAIRSADIFLDQFICGAYGLATCEAMAMGKPVFCYLMPKVVEKLPADCPIINTSVDTLESTLEQFISNPALRNATGRLSRQYAEKYHDADKIAVQLKTLFNEILQHQ